MDWFYPFWFWFWFLYLTYKACFQGEKTSDNDEEIKDYWSDG